MLGITDTVDGQRALAAFVFSFLKLSPSDEAMEYTHFMQTNYTDSFVNESKELFFVQMFKGTVSREFNFNCDCKV